MKFPPIANPPNPYLSTEVEYLEAPPPGKLEVYADLTREILSQNDSPDLGFRYSLNPYRGCMHACAYCYARPTHEYLSLGAGTDFETKIAVKLKAAELLRAHFERPSWRGELIVFSGVTDCYQPLEASYKLTRACLSVCAEYRNPVGIITKAPLIERDLDILQELAAHSRLHVNISVPFWNAEHARAIEPMVATPQRRIQTIERLAKAGVSVGVMVAPIIPGLSDEDMPKVLAAAKEAGACTAGYVLLRLPGSVKEVFAQRLRAALPNHAEKVLHRIRETRGGKLYDLRFGNRGVGEGLYASTLASLFEISSRNLGFNAARPVDGPTPFQRPRERRQLHLL